MIDMKYYTAALKKADKNGNHWLSKKEVDAAAKKINKKDGLSNTEKALLDLQKNFKGFAGVNKGGDDKQISSGEIQKYLTAANPIKKGTPLKDKKGVPHKFDKQERSTTKEYQVGEKDYEKAFKLADKNHDNKLSKKELYTTTDKYANKFATNEKKAKSPANARLIGALKGLEYALKKGYAGEDKNLSKQELKKHSKELSKDTNVAYVTNNPNSFVQYPDGYKELLNTLSVTFDSDKSGKNRLDLTFFLKA